jgi:hypothetical protein
VTGIFPNSGDVPHSIRLYSALFYLVSVAAVFTYLLYSGYQTTLNTQFLAPYLGNHALPNRNCQLVPISYTGKFLVSDDGYWEGAHQFSYNRATYSFSVVAYSATDKVFKHDMNNIHIGLVEAGAVASTSPLFTNLLLWMSLVFVNNSNAQRFNLVGDPLVIFDRQHLTASASSVKGNCNVSSTSSFDHSNGHMTIEWIYEDFIAEPLCMATMDPVLMGYDTMTMPEIFSIVYDIRTLITSLAVNLGILKTDQLEEIVKFASSVVSNGILIAINHYYDPRYPAMDPFRCARINGGPPTCFIAMDQVKWFAFFCVLWSNGLMFR